jgi:hypothetical protein
MIQCKNCGETFEPKTKRAVFCSDSCRVSFYQKQKRLKEKKPIKAVPIWIQKNISKAAVWFFLIVLFMFSIPYVFDKGMRIYTDYRVEWQNEKLEELEKTVSELGNKPRLIEENQRLKYHLKVLLNVDNGWMSGEAIREYKVKVLQKDEKLIE